MDGPTLEGVETLILIPTAGEAQSLGPERLAQAQPVALCGFGPIAAAASTARELARLRPQRVLLVGIAGSFDVQRHPIGTAAVFTQVRVDGIGAGEGAEAQTPRDLGLPQWSASDDGPGVFDTLPLSSPDPIEDRTLLTVCSCSASTQQADRRRRDFQDPAAEDMEGFGVALACRQFGTPLGIVRGISNAVGNRDTRSWRIKPAMHAAWDAMLELLADQDWGRES